MLALQPTKSAPPVPQQPAAQRTQGRKRAFSEVIKPVTGRGTGLDGGRWRPPASAAKAEDRRVHRLAVGQSAALLTQAHRCAALLLCGLMLLANC